MGRQLRFFDAAAAVQNVHELLQMGGLARRAQELPNLVVEGDQPDAVLLMENQVAERRGGQAGIIVLGDGVRAVMHRFADIEHQPTDEVRLLLVLLEEESTGAAVDFPVHVANVVARDIFAVLRELDRKAVVRALCSPDKYPSTMRRACISRLRTFAKFKGSRYL